MRIDLLPARFIRQCNRGQLPNELLRLPLAVRMQLGQLGVDYDELAKRVAHLQRGARFPEMVKILFQNAGPPATWSETAALFRRNLGGTDAAARDWLRRGFLPDSEGFTDVDRDNFLAVLRNLVAPDRTLAELQPGDMAALYGRRRRTPSHELDVPRWISQKDVARGCARVAAIVDEEVGEIAVNNSADVLKRNLYSVRGFSGATGTYMTRSGFGWGTLSEIRVVAVLLELGHAANRLRLSMPMPDGALGPDIMIYRALKSLGHGISKRLFSVVQCKALKDFGTMVSPGSSSESLRQLCGDTRRMGAEVPLRGSDVRPPWHGPTRNEGGDGVGALFDGGYSFTFDFWHFIRNGDSPFVTIGNQVRNLQGRADEVFPGTLKGVDLINRAKELMREVMNYRAAVLQDTINILRTHPQPDEVVTYTQEIGDQLMHAINNQVLRKHKDDKSVGRLPMAELTPAKLKNLNIITQEQSDLLTTLLPPTSAQYRIAAARMALELSDQALETMPKFNVSMGIVEEGGSWINQGFALLTSLLPRGGS